MKNNPLHNARSFRTGKDLASLLSRGENNSATSNVSPPSNETESALYVIWNNLLGHDNFGVKDDFFSIGGNSLKAVQLLSRIFREFSVSVNLSDVFIHPTIAGLSAHILKQEKSDISNSIITIDKRPDRLPLSFSQERLWFIDRMEGSIQYHIPDVMRFKGELDKDVLERSLKTIVNRHEVLRTVILEKDGEPYQSINEEDSWSLHIDNVNQFENDAKGLEQYIHEIINKSFDLSKDNMMRAHLLTLNKQEHILVVNFHHIASDGWSISVFRKEFIELYSAYVNGQMPELESLKLQYADYAIWQRQYLQGEVLDKKISYWKEKLDGVAPLQLPVDHTRPIIQSTKGARAGIIIGKELSEQLQQLSQRHNATLFMTLLSAFKALLYRYSHQEDICVGTPIAGRQQTEAENLIGFFVDTVALRSKISGDITFIELLQQIKTTMLEAYKYHEAPFEKVVNAVIKERDLSRSPIFQVMFHLEDEMEMPELKPGNLSVSATGYTLNTSKFDLSFFITETHDGLHLSTEYCTDLYTENTVARMMGHFGQLLFSIVKNPEQSISRLLMLTTEEQEQLLHTFNNTATKYSKDKTIVHLFEEQVIKTPDNIAIEFDEEQHSYKELNERANSLAHYLQSLGVKQETLVPICIDRSFEMVIGILGILKAGGAYVPIDPKYPQKRICFMLDDIGSGILLSNNATISKFQINEGIKIIELDTIWTDISKYSANNFQIDVKPQNLAYVIYTSGSTGIPKGTLITHSGVFNYLSWCIKAYKVADGNGAPVSSSIAFDATITSFFSPLLVGKSILLLPEEGEIEALGSALRSKKHFSLVKITPAHLEILQHLLPPEEIDGQTNALIIGGEALFQNSINLWRIHAPGTRLINEYGPTETVVGCCVYEIEQGSLLPEEIPIGRPIANTQLYILDQHMQPVPIGVTGEIYIGGAGVARGYHNRAEMTAEKFLENIFSDDKNSQLYKTGDLAHYLNDGNIVFSGRIDQQVKIRGYRIELAEIEFVILQSGLVLQTIVLAKEEDSSNEKRLIGYIVPEKKFELSALTIYLKDKLPEYMVPGLWVVLESFPLTVNGKVDKKALPDPNASELLTNQYIAPRNKTEEALAKIWQDVLEVDQVGINDDFFEMGGHSLLAMRLITAIRKELKIELPFNDVFLYPTIARLVGHLGEKSKELLLPAIIAQPRPKSIPLSFSQERLWFIDRLEGSLHYHMPLVLNLKGNLNKTALAFALQNIINRHEILRTVIREKNGELYQHIQEKDSWQLSMVDGYEYHNNVQALKQIANKLVETPFDLSQDYMFRATLISLNEKEYRLVINVHHIASDGWSRAIILQELIEGYNAYVEKRQAKLPVLTLQYADYSLWQRQYLQGTLLEEKLLFWKEKLYSVEPFGLPTDFPRPAIQGISGALVQFYLDKKISEGLKQLSQQEGTTPFMTVLAAFKVLLHRYSNQEDICIGSVIVDRQKEEMENLIGFFLNTIALRNNVNSENSFIEFLQQVRVSTMEVYQHQEVPFEKVVETVVKERDVSRSPLFQVMFIWENTRPIPEISLGGIKVFQEDIGLTKSKYDITFIITELAEGLKINVEYSTDLYSEETIKRMIGHFKELLSSVVENPHERLGHLQMLTFEEKNQLLVNFNDTIASYPKQKTIIDLFEEKALQVPDSMALLFEDKQMSYKQLNEKANQLAHYLRSKGVKEETLVPICIERSLEMIIGILGILKAGGAYVPIDPEYPEERISYMLKDTNAAIVVSSKESWSKLQTPEGVEVVELDTDWRTINMQSTENLQVHIQPHHLAYLIYTSGSTGKPKGVMIEHGSVVNLITTQSVFFNITADERILQFSNYTFDASVEQIFLSLFNGASLILFTEGLQLDKNLFESFLNDKSISHLHATPSFLENVTPYNYKCLKRVIAGGDLCKKELAEKWNSTLTFYNEYGPTETTVTAIEYQTHPTNNKEKIVSLPIGKPLSNTQVYILNNAGTLCPVGVFGVIHIGGVQVARGYLNMPQLTTAKFIKNPFSTIEDSRLYCTGDLGRWLADGNIEYLGRIDNQVKINGYRIELEEIESILQQSDLVSQAAVLARNDANGHKRLIGYVVPNGIFNKEAIITNLKSRLPHYIIPALWVELAELPLTSNGKIDRNSLPDPEMDLLSKKEYEAPLNEVEEKLAIIWQDLLGIKKVGIHDNFFELGGHSLLAMKMVSVIERNLLLSIPISALFQFTTISDLSKYIEIQSIGFSKNTNTSAFELIDI